MRPLSFLLISLFLTGCAVLYPQPKQPVLQDQQGFCLAFEEFQESHRIDNLKKLTVDFPDSVWASRAETIILYSQELDQRKQENKKLRESAQQQTLELEQLGKRNQQLKIKTVEQNKLNQQLAEQIAQLKSLLIQLEKHPQ